MDKTRSIEEPFSVAQHVLDAIKIVEGKRHVRFESYFTERLAACLKIYLDKGEFDGTFASAWECLLKAGFQLELPN